MAKNIKRHITHIKSNVVENNKPKLPQADDINFGEIAVNYADGYETISIKTVKPDNTPSITPFSSDEYYTKQKLGNDFMGVNSGRTVTDALSAMDTKKTDVSAFTEHTTSNVHMDPTEKTNLDSLATNIATISGITSQMVSNWNTASANTHTHDNKAVLDNITAAYTIDEKNKLSGIEDGAQVNVIETVKVNGTALTPSSKAVNVTVPTTTSELTNNSNFVSDASYVHTDNNYTTPEKNKLRDIEAGAEVNQNAFSNIKVGSTTVVADSQTDTVTLIGGGIVSIAANDSNDSITISASVDWNNIGGKPSSFTPSAHNHASNEVSAMTGYAKASAEAAISASDTLNVAIGKLEKGLDGKQPTGNYAYKSDLNNLFDSAEYEMSGSSHVINFYHGTTLIDTINADAFIKDGMVDNVVISGGNLVITFNTDSGKQPITIPLTDIFNPDNYYQKDKFTDSVSVKFNRSGAGSSETISAEVKNISAATFDSTSKTVGTKFSEIDSALGGKVNTSDVVTAITTQTSASTNPIATSVVASAHQTIAEAINDLNESVSNVESGLDGKQDTLVSGTNIKTINGDSILGSGNIVIQGGSSYSPGRGIDISSNNEISVSLPISAGTGTNSIIEGIVTTASGSYSHAEGNYTIASGSCSHTEGTVTAASGRASHAEGIATHAYGEGSHSEGANTTADGDDSHAEGSNTTASGNYSHAEGHFTTANGESSHAEGSGTTANNASEHACGQYNVSSAATTTFGGSGNTLFSVGNGTADDARHNAFEIRQNGDIYITLNDQDVKLQDQLGGGGGDVPSSRKISTGNGLLGGGDLSADRTISVNFGNAQGTVCQGNDARLSDSRTPTAHDQASSTITAMTGYVKAFTTSAIVTGDTLNGAIGKLEKALDNTASVAELTNYSLGAEVPASDTYTIYGYPAEVKLFESEDVLGGIAFYANGYYYVGTVLGSIEGDIIMLNYRYTSSTVPYDIKLLFNSGGFAKLANQLSPSKIGLVNVLSTNYNDNIGKGAVIEGEGTSSKTIDASGDYSHAEGNSTAASGESSHAEGSGTQASGKSSHAEGWYTTANGFGSHAEGLWTTTSNDAEHACGQYNVSSVATTTFGGSGNTLFSVGNGTADDARHNAFEIRQNGDIYIVKNGLDVKLQDQLGGGGSASVVELTNYSRGSEVPLANVYTIGGLPTESKTKKEDGMIDTIVFHRTDGGNNYSYYTGHYVVALELGTVYHISNIYSEVNVPSDIKALFGHPVTAGTGTNSVIEGSGTTASGESSHAEGSGTQASGKSSHAEGWYTTANGFGSHAEGLWTTTSNDAEHACGQYNVSSSASTTFGDSGNTLFSVGNGEDDFTKHNAFEIRQNGTLIISIGNTTLTLDETKLNKLIQLLN